MLQASQNTSLAVWVQRSTGSIISSDRSDVVISVMADSQVVRTIFISVRLNAPPVAYEIYGATGGVL